jgi:putative colanic acid biosynthesis acetyltransferase WcaF
MTWSPMRGREAEPRRRLDRFDSRSFDRGRSLLVEALWQMFDLAFIRSGLPGSRHRVAVLRAFGARIGEGVVVKPYVRVKFPWRLSIGAHSWIGEGAWIDNLAEVSIGAHCCVSQGAYLCTGSHDWRKESFDLVTRPIRVDDGAWVCARACIAPGVTIGAGAIVSFGAVVTKDVEPFALCQAAAASVRPSSGGS